MRVVFRADSSLEIGTGHVMRCLTLADALTERGADCIFVCRELPGNLIDLIEQQGFSVVPLSSLATEGHIPETTAPIHAHWLGVDWETDARQTYDAINGSVVDWLVVDHYALDARWEKSLRGTCNKIFVIDDLADRPHDCDVLLDQNLRRAAKDYSGFIEKPTVFLIGPKYSMIRPQFLAHRRQSLERRKAAELRHILVLMGGSDNQNYTMRVLEILGQCPLPENLKITVVMGKHAPFIKEVRAKASLMPVKTEILVGVVEMAALMASADLSIGAAGGTAWERCVLGVPSLVLVLAMNQEESAKALASVGAVKVIYDLSELASGSYFGDIDKLLMELEPLSTAASKVIDGKGVYRVVEAFGFDHG